MAFWDKKKVLITGHTGFKGSWLSIMLHMLGAQIIGYALDPRTSDDNFGACGINSKIIDIRGNIRDFNSLKQVFRDYEPEAVFHLAAQPLVLDSYKDIRSTYETNVMGTLNVLECIKECPETKCAVIVTTDKCYENKEQIWGYKETDRLGGYDPYSSSKACAEILVASYRNSFLNIKDYETHKKAISTARAGNVIGGGDWSPYRIIPDCVKSIMRDGKVKIRNPNAVRPWQHVIEPLYGYVLLAQKMLLYGGEYCEAWNFGPQSSSNISVWELADLLLREFGTGELIDAGSKTAPHETGFLSLDITKAAMKLGWKPVILISQAIEMTAAWHKLYKDMQGVQESENEMFNLCKKQIEDYLSKVCG